MNDKIVKLRAERDEIRRRLSSAEEVIREARARVELLVDAKIPIQKELDDITEILGLFENQG